MAHRQTVAEATSNWFTHGRRNGCWVVNPWTQAAVAAPENKARLAGENRWGNAKTKDRNAIKTSLMAAVRPWAAAHQDGDRG